MKVLELFSRRPALRSWVRLLVAGVAPFAASAPVLAADHFVAAGTSSFNCGPVAAGDTVTLAAGTRGSLTIRDCNGAAGRPIVVRNDPRGTGPTVLRRSSGNSGGFVLDCSSCVYTEIDGSAKWVGAPSGKTYGISLEMTGGGSPSAFVRISGTSRFLTVRSVEVDGAWPSLATDGIGISVNDHGVKAAGHPGLWREGIKLEDNYIHNVEGEGLYVGPNWELGDLKLRDIEISGNRIEDTGWDGIQLKSAVQGTNLIHHNMLKRVGSRRDSFAGQHYGISIYEGTGRIYNNWVERSGEAGISHFLHHLPASYGAQACDIFNNVVVDAGQGGPNPGYGIVSNNKSGTAVPLPRIYNNTVVGSRDTGIKVGPDAAGGFVSDNIVADSARTAITTPSKVSNASNRTGTSSQMGFVNGSGLNFRLASGSAARNAASKSLSPVDYSDVSRPQEGAADQGAFEFDVGEQDSSRPNPPVITSVN